MASTTLLRSSILTPLLNTFPSLQLPIRTTTSNNISRSSKPKTTSLKTNCSNPTTPSPQTSYSSEEDYDDDDDEVLDDDDDDDVGHAPPLRSRRRRYRKQYPGEHIGITEEMRFVAMKLRNTPKSKNSSAKSEEVNGLDSVSEESNGGSGESWEPSLKGFLNYLVDTNHVFTTIERIVDQSTDVSYVYFRKTGLERAQCLSRDLEWFCQEGNSIPEPSNPGITYANYLKEIANKSPALFMSHFYNIYFAHIAGGQVIAKKVSKKILNGRELEFFKWEGNEEELLKGVREKLNMLGEHWSRDEKNKCLREATKSFRFWGQIVRLIIL